MDKLLISSRAKIVRAGKHIEAAQDISQRFLHDDFYTTAQERDGERHLIVRVTGVQPFPYDFGLVVGDAAHNIRSALDHIAFRFAKPADDRAAGQVAFPTISKPENFAGVIPRRLPGVSPEALALFESYQPYNSGQRPKNNFLLQIAAINNWDKHHALAVALTSAEVFEIGIDTTGAVQIVSRENYSGRLEVGTILTRIEIAPTDAAFKVDMHANLRLHPIFDDCMPDVSGAHVVGTIYEAAEFVFETVIPDFERLL